MASPSNQPPPSGCSPPPGPPPTGPPPPGPPPSGCPPPPPPSPTTPSGTITSANYFFGFVITFVVLLLLFVGCGVGSWRRFRIVGTAWDVRLQSIDGSPVVGRRRGRRRLVRPVFLERWASPTDSAYLVPGKWQGVQPISAAFIWSRTRLVASASRPEGATAVQTPARQNDSSVRDVGAMIRSFVLPRRPRFDQPPRPPPPVERPPPPEAIRVAVFIAMPCPPSALLGDKPSYVGHPNGGEYQIGVVQIRWPRGDGS